MTREGTLRHPSYLGLREDKKPEAVVLETEEDVETATAPASIPISNRDRVIYPEAGLTKGELADYYARSEEHTSELQSLMRISYAVFCLKKNNTKSTQTSPVTSYNIPCQQRNT